MDFYDVINTRVTTRKYSDKQIPEEILKKILDMGIKAPIASAQRNKMHITVIQDKVIMDEMKESVCEYFGKKLDPFYGAPTLILVSGASYEPIGFGKQKWSQKNIEIANASCIIENMLLGATYLGIANAYITGFISCFSVNPSLIKKLNIPQNFSPIGGMLLGYAEGKAKKLKTNGEIAIDYIVGKK